MGAGQRKAPIDPATSSGSRDRKGSQRRRSHPSESESFCGWLGNRSASERLVSLWGNPKSSRLGNPKAASSTSQVPPSVHTLTATKTQVVIGMTVLVHYPSAVPKRGSPAAPIIVSPISVEDEPAAFHFRVTQRLAAETRHFTLIQR